VKPALLKLFLTRLGGEFLALAGEFQFFFELVRSYFIKIFQLNKNALFTVIQNFFDVQFIK